MDLDRRRGIGRRAVAVALGLMVGAIAPGIAPGAEPLPQEFRADFTKGEFDIRDLALCGGHAEELVQAEPAGLRIKIPPNMNKPEGVGIRTRSPIRGDFDIEATFDILRADKPTEGYGIGAQMTLETATPTHEAVTAEWTSTPGKDGVRFISTRIAGKPDGQRDYRVQSLPATRRSGTLRLVRTGPMIRAVYREDGAGERSVPPVPLGAEDVAEVKLVANTGVSDHPVEIRLKSLTIRAKSLPGWAGATGTGAAVEPVDSGPPSPPLARPIAIGAVVVVAVAGLLALCAWLVGRPSARGKSPGGPSAPGDDRPATWEDDPLAELEGQAEAFAREHPDAEVFFEPGHCQFTLRAGVVDGPCVVWWRVEPNRLRRPGQTWDDVRKQLPKRYRGQYRAGRRDGIWQAWDTTGGTVAVTFRDGERV